MAQTRIWTGASCSFSVVRADAGRGVYWIATMSCHTAAVTSAHVQVAVSPGNRCDHRMVHDQTTELLDQVVRDGRRSRLACRMHAARQTSCRIARGPGFAFTSSAILVDRIHKYINLSCRSHVAGVGCARRCCSSIASGGRTQGLPSNGRALSASSTEVDG